MIDGIILYSDFPFKGGKNYHVLCGSVGTPFIYHNINVFVILNQMWDPDVAFHIPRSHTSGDYTP